MKRENYGRRRRRQEMKICAKERVTTILFLMAILASEEKDVCTSVQKNNSVQLSARMQDS